jgi:hypothetical protein
VRHFAVVALVVLFFLSMTTFSVSASSSGHGCAPRIPPTLPGSPAPAVSGVIVINEVLLVPHSTWNCSESPGTYSVIADTWIELYNTQNQPFNLYASHAAFDSGPGTIISYFPFGASIAAHGHLVLFPRYDASFLLSETSTLRLVIGGVVINQVTVPQLAPDQSYARTTDGASNWQVISSPTIDSSNSSTSQATPTLSGHNGPGVTPESKNGASGTPPGNSFNNTKSLVNGVQPQWNNLQLPTTVTPTAATNTDQPTVPATVAPASNISNVPRQIILTVLLILLTLVILWCWRIYYKRSP